MISKYEILIIHNLVISRFGGKFGIRDENLLESAIQRMNAGIGDVELYSTPVDKASTIIESIVKNHPFLDGNKRTGYVLMRIILMKFNLDINATEDEKYDFVIAIAEGKSNFEDIKSWITKHLRK